VGPGLEVFEWHQGHGSAAATKLQPRRNIRSNRESQRDVHRGVPAAVSIRGRGRLAECRAGSYAMRSIVASSVASRSRAVSAS
jgi:hypothetical protein